MKNAIISVALLVTLVPAVAFAQIPRTLSYQGVLTDTTGTPKPDGTYAFTFRLFETETGGNELWSETRTLSVERGLFRTVLGENTTFGPALIFDKQYWLSIQVGSQPEMFPRIPLTSVGYSLNSLKADTATFALSAPMQGTVDSARAAGTASTLRLPSRCETMDPTYGLAVSNFGDGDAIRAYSTSTKTTYAAVYASNTATSGAGTAVYAQSAKGVGLYASSNESDAIEAAGVVAGKSGLYAHSIDGVGAACRSSSNFGVTVGGGGDGSGYDNMGDLRLEGNRGEIFADGDVLNLFSNGYIVLDLDNDNNALRDFEIWSGTDQLVFWVDETGNMSAIGTKSAMIRTDTQGDRLVYATESPEVWLEDIGSAQLLGGTARVDFEGTFVQTINTAVPYHVFVTANSGQPVILFVSEKGQEGFTVKGVGLNGKVSDCSFDYRVIAKRRGYENVRLSPVDPANNAKNAVAASSSVTGPAVQYPHPVKNDKR